MNIEKERKAFEEWASSNKWNIFKLSFANDDVEKYANDFVEGAWHGCIQSANREGYKLMPVCKHEWSIQLSGRFICDACGEFMDKL